MLSNRCLVAFLGVFALTACDFGGVSPTDEVFEGQPVYAATGSVIYNQYRGGGPFPRFDDITEEQYAADMNAQFAKHANSVCGGGYRIIRKSQPSGEIAERQRRSTLFLKQTAYFICT